MEDGCALVAACGCLQRLHLCDGLSAFESRFDWRSRPRRMAASALRSLLGSGRSPITPTVPSESHSLSACVSPTLCTSVSFCLFLCLFCFLCPSPLVRRLVGQLFLHLENRHQLIGKRMSQLKVNWRVI